MLRGNGSTKFRIAVRTATPSYNTSKGRVAYAPSLKRYAPLAAVETRKDLVATMTPGTLEPALTWLANLIVGTVSPFDTISAATVTGAGGDFTEIRMDNSEYALTATFSKDTPPLLLSMSLDFKEPLITKYKFPEGAALSITIGFANWQMSPAVEDSTFEFVPPLDAAQATLQELSTKPKIETGQPAPLFSVEQLGGGTVNLKDHIGKDVVMLEFWSTHCTVCQKLAPCHGYLGTFQRQELHLRG